MPTVAHMIFDGPATQNAFAQAVSTPPPPSSTRVGVAPYAAMIGGNAADLGTTIAALHANAGREANPLYGGNHLPAIVGAKIGATGLTAWAMHHLGDTGHAKTAKVLGYADGLAFGILAAHNALAMKK